MSDIARLFDRGHSSIQRILTVENSVVSDWVRDEAREGYDRGILVPVRIDDIKPPLGFRRSQTADLVGWPASGDEI